MQKPKTTRSLVSEDERVRYVEGSTCLTIWYDKVKDIIAFEVIFGLIFDEWAFLYHRKGTSRYCKVDDGEGRIGRPQKQAMSGLYDLPSSRVEEFFHFDGKLPDKDKGFILNKMKEKRVK
jgi:hypothetical protein